MDAPSAPAGDRLAARGDRVWIPEWREMEPIDALRAEAGRYADEHGLGRREDGRRRLVAHIRGVMAGLRLPDPVVASLRPTLPSLLASAIEERRELRRGDADDETRIVAAFWEGCGASAAEHVVLLDEAAVVFARGSSIRVSVVRDAVHSVTLSADDLWARYVEEQGMCVATGYVCPLLFRRIAGLFVEGRMRVEADSLLVRIAAFGRNTIEDCLRLQPDTSAAAGAARRAASEAKRRRDAQRMPPPRPRPRPTALRRRRRRNASALVDDSPEARLRDLRTRRASLLARRDELSARIVAAEEDVFDSQAEELAERLGEQLDACDRELAEVERTAKEVESEVAKEKREAAERAGAAKGVEERAGAAKGPERAGAAKGVEERADEEVLFRLDEEVPLPDLAERALRILDEGGRVPDSDVRRLALALRARDASEHASGSDSVGSGSGGTASPPAKKARSGSVDSASSGSSAETVAPSSPPPPPPTRVAPRSRLDELFGDSDED